MLHMHSHFDPLQTYQSPLSCGGVCMRLSGACSVNKTVLHFPFKYGSYCICSVGQDPQREERISVSSHN